MAKNSGHIFEQEFKKSIPEGVYCKKLAVAGSNYRGSGNEGDFLVYKYPRLYVFELKSHKGKSVPFSKIRENQLKGLELVRYIPGIESGIIFNLRDLEATYYVPIREVLEYIASGDRKSFPIEWMELKGIRLEQRKARTRYTYNILKLLSDIER